MTTYAFPSIEPSFVRWSKSSNTAVFNSSQNGAIQTLDRGGERWQFEYRFLNLFGANKALMESFLTKLNGQQHRFTVHRYGKVQGGAFGGTPLVNGASQTGLSIILDGASNSITDWIVAGDHFSVGGELKMATANASSDGSGNITIPFTPRLRVSPADNAALTTTNPTGIFLLASNIVNWSNKPVDFADFVVQAIEDIAQ